ncbi:serine-rich adhesin for platelets-like isoform X3 [Vespa velutina]|uniref:serine-rich adhesin for platelets-like isoform X3 n=1 Tax=Vespa velutina TaxID=202808 RepID=UPI001FB4F36A|nr:serine-rich adhesin for platelets-like isoform X3 [Vespa velutina]
MSADSPRRSVHKGAQVVSPQPIVDRSIIDSVAGIINDIVPQILSFQAYTTTPSTDNKESISWARFEYADINDPALYPDFNEGSSTPPLLLVLGYSTGVQVWLIAATGEATEVLSWRQGIVRTLRILPNPKTDSEHADPYEPKRPLVAICDSAGPGPQFCNISFISLKTGEQTKNIKFKNPVCDILANRRSIVVTFLEKIAVFDARTFEDILTVTTCYPSPGPNPNPVALGTRWLAYRRSSGGCEGEGVQSYTATVLYAAKSLGKGLRGLGETVASSLTGNSVSPLAVNNMGNDVTQPGVVMILDLQAAKEEKDLDDTSIETVIAHFTAHSDAIVAMTFDLTGALLMTADKRGHDFHIFRVQPHPGGPTLAAVHHLYILHRGDTTAKVQDMTFSADTRWAAVSTVRGTTHVFPVAPYGGSVGVRTHLTPHVVNRLSRFHRSAGLTDDGTRSHSPVSHTELPLSVYPYSNPRLPPYPHPTILHPLAQIRQPSSLNHVNSQAQPRPQQRQRLHSDDSGTLPLKICACFAPPRAWIYAQRDSGSKVAKRAVDSLFIMACHGNMIQYDLEPKPATGVPKEKVCDDTMIELEVEAKGQWPLLRSPNSMEIVPPLALASSLFSVSTVPNNVQPLDTSEDGWLSQVEIVTHAGPHRRLWMGPQFVFKTYNAPSGVSVNLVEAEAVEIGITGGSRPARSNPVNMPHAASRPLVPVVIDGSGSSYEQSPRFMEAYGDSLDNEHIGVGSGENQLREDLAEAMLETSIAPHRAPGRRSVFERVGQPVTKVVNPLGTVITVSADEEDVSSSQEFDSAEESLVPEAPRSVCAEEGPASLGDLEPPCYQTLRDLTEICAEMRSASEPAIDSVPDENIRDIKERKELCVEVASMKSAGNCSIDFEREDAFRDVPSGLSLCAEQGEIPSSPMTEAKESTARSKRSNKYEHAETQEKSIAKAKYVVNYDEDSVVLMENRLSCEKANPQMRVKNQQTFSSSSSSSFSFYSPSSSRHQSKDTEKTTKTSKQPVKELRTRIDKYIVKEQDDSVVIEDPTRCNTDTKNNCIGKKHCDLSKEDKCRLNDECVSKTDHKLDQKVTENTKCKSKSKDTDTIKESEGCCGSTDRSFVELDKPNANDDGIANVECKEENETIPSDDFNSMEYHLVDSNCPIKDSTVSDHSDEDIEHIQRSELMRVRESSDRENSEKFMDLPSYSDTSPVTQRKNSKSTISDDDLEYIHTSELVEIPDNKYNLGTTSISNVEKSDEDCSISSKGQSKHTLSSDDDLEHIQHSDVCASPLETTTTAITTTTTTTATTTTTTTTIMCPTKADEQNPNIKSQETIRSSKSKATKRRKDIFVIEDNTTDKVEVRVMVDPTDKWIASSKHFDKKATEETQQIAIGEKRFGSVAKVSSETIRGEHTASKSKGTKKRKDIVVIEEDSKEIGRVEIQKHCWSISKKCQEKNINDETQNVDLSTVVSTSNQKKSTISFPNVQQESIQLEQTCKSKINKKPKDITWMDIHGKQVCKMKGNKKKKDAEVINETWITESNLLEKDPTEDQERKCESCDQETTRNKSKILSEELDKCSDQETTSFLEGPARIDNDFEIMKMNYMHKVKMTWNQMSSRHKTVNTIAKKPRDGLRTTDATAFDAKPLYYCSRKVTTEKLQEAAEELNANAEMEKKIEELLTNNPRVSIFKKKNLPMIESETSRKESSDLEPLVEVEEKLDEKLKLQSTSKVDENLDDDTIKIINEDDKISEEVNKITEDEDIIMVVDEEKINYEEDEEEEEDINPPMESTSSKENSPESDYQQDKRRSDSDQDIIPERRSSSPDDLNANGGSQSVASYEDLSSSSFSSASRASLDARSSPTPSYGAENMMVFPGDSSGSI